MKKSKQIVQENYAYNKDLKQFLIKYMYILNMSLRF